MSAGSRGAKLSPHVCSASETGRAAEATNVS